ncbi:MAG TPA: PaaI family thioesterase [Streptosporangiaceae bacterium]|nr:PaaI family thioesterase [Streptosporangiaceae bacterium]
MTTSEAGQPGTSEPAPLAPEIDARVRASVVRQTMLTTIGVTVERLESGYCELGLARRADLTQQHGFIHAGAITTLADSACGYAAYTLMPADRDVLTVDFSLNLIAPASHPKFVAAGRVIRSGRTITTCRGEVYGVADDGQRTAIALIQATMMAVTRMSA